MPADLSLSREEIDRAAHHVALLGHANAPSPVPGLTVGRLLGVLCAAEAHLSEPTRLASARQEGYREGVEAALRAVCAIGPDEEEFGGTWAVGRATDRIRALTPPPAEPSAPVAEGE